jgi:hypothetical protein
MADGRESGSTGDARMSRNEEKAPRFAGIGGHHSHRSGTVEWLTPPEIIAALGPFDLDPCASVTQPWPCAARSFTRADNGLLLKWAGRVWLNPPYNVGEIEKWMARLAEHGRGTALIFARTETDAFFRHVWERAAALLFMRGRINFHFGEPWRCPRTGHRYEVGDRAPGNAGAPTVLCAYGIDDADILAACRIDGRFVPLRFPRIALLFALTNESKKSDNMTWREAVAAFFADRDGPIELDELYRHFRVHPKAAGNRNVEAKVRQQLQFGPYRRTAPGAWQKEAP